MSNGEKEELVQVLREAEAACTKAQSEVQVAKVQAQSVVKVTRAQVKAVKAQLNEKVGKALSELRAERSLHQQTMGKYMQARGKLHMTGLIEVVEEQFLRVDPAEVKGGRLGKWKAILSSEHLENKELLACLQKCFPGKLTSDKIAEPIHALYQHLSGHIHKYIILQESNATVDIVQGAVNSEQMGALECFAKALRVGYKLHYNNQ